MIEVFIVRYYIFQRATVKKDRDGFIHKKDALQIFFV
jgi:hypothetical protein